MFIVWSSSFDDLITYKLVNYQKITACTDKHTWEAQRNHPLNMNVFSCSNNVISLVGSGVSVHARQHVFFCTSTNDTNDSM